MKLPKLFIYFRVIRIIFTLIFLVTFKSRYCAVHNRREVLCRGSRVVVEITMSMEITMLTNLKIAVVAALLIASASTAFAQRATVAGQRAPVALTSQETGPFEHMSRAE